MAEIANFDQYKKLAVEAADHYNRQDYKSALPRFQELAKVNPDNFKIHETLSYIHLKLKRLDDAEREYKIALKLAKEQNANVAEPVTFEELVRQAGDFKQVEMEYDKLMNQPASRDVFINSKAAIHLGIHYMSRGEYKKAEQILTEFKNKYEPVLVG